MNCARLEKYNFVHESGTILSNYLLYITFINELNKKKTPKTPPKKKSQQANNI